MMKKPKPHSRSEEEIDAIVLAQADDETAWTKPILVRRPKPAAVSLPPHLAAQAAFFAQAGIPFACLRAISDEVGTTLSPTLESLLSGGSASPWRVLLALARRPGMLPELLRLARDTKRAAQQLGLALGELLTLTLPWDLDVAQKA